MKKISVFIVALFYLAISSGMIVNLHYCMNRFSSADMGFVTKDECGICGMDKSKSNGCCHDEIKLVKLQGDQNKTAQVAFDFTAFQSIAVIPSKFISTSFYNTDQNNHQVEHSPPLLKQQDLQSKNCVFRI
ncbi:MAG: hypothetical protein JST09_10600 [Bacteroidetes bacterium]|nr:hypothetical protein [Bacteroidota bacterium]